MANLWFSSDPHLGHANLIYKFKKDCPDCALATTDEARAACMCCGGTGEIPMRPFKDLNEMHTAIVEQHNARVRPQDHWWCLGDLTMERHLRMIDGVLEQMNGHKRIILGNHDMAPSPEYLERFEKVVSYRVLDNIMFSHIAIHPASMGKFEANVHGHIHSNQSGKFPAAKRHDGLVQPYVNISMEVTNYAPLSFEEVKERIKKARTHADHS